MPLGMKWSCIYVRKNNVVVVGGGGCDSDSDTDDQIMGAMSLWT